MNTFTWLLKREFWESKGGFFWAPMVAGIIFLAFNIMAFVTALAFGSREHIRVSGVNISELTVQALGADERAVLGAGLDMALYMAASWPMIVLAFVVFFYCLSAMYDERRDRSVLFWKSLPISDAATVGSKLATAALVGPAIAVIAAVLTMIGFLLVISAFVLAHGGNPIALVWGPASPLKVTATLLLTLPIYALWALPTIGWLLLCSAWAKTKPFLWAVMLPIFAGILVTWFKIMQVFDLSATWFWTNVVARMLTSTVPASDLFYRDYSQGQLERMNDAREMLDVLSIGNAYASLASPHMWVGAIAGLVMIVIAIRLRRFRDEG